jgi:hypothetical protein
MALIVEDGSGKTDADALCSVAFVDTYNSEYNSVASWISAAADVKERAIRLATQYIDEYYKKMWKGEKSSYDQSLTWPRVNVEDEDDYTIDSDVVPLKIQQAVAELSIRVVNGDDLFSDVKSPSGMIQSKKVKVGPIEVATEFSGSGAPETTFTVVDNLVSSYTYNGGISVQTFRT